MSDRPHWEHFSHRADMGVRGLGRTPAEAFEQAALALTAVVTDPALVRPKQVEAIELEAPNLEFLFYDWLNELVFLMAGRGLLFSRFAVRIQDHHLQARVWGEPLDPRRHRPAVEVKGATLTELEVKRRPDGLWLAQTVVDL